MDPDPDPGGPKTYGSEGSGSEGSGSGSATLKENLKLSLSDTVCVSDDGTCVVNFGKTVLLCMCDCETLYECSTQLLLICAPNF